MIVETAKRKDLTDLMTLENVCYDYPNDKERWSLILSTQDITRCGVIRQNSKLIAFVLYYPMYDFETGDPAGDGELVDFEIECMHIWRIGVAPKYRRKSYGSILIEHVRKEAREEQIMQVSAIISEYAAEENPGLDLFLKANQLNFDRIEKDQYQAYGRWYDGLIYEGLNAYDPKLKC
jgi:ribosomal protein S18 acetylase RimI-like enzyme